ncbi:winged helix-turn-helix domain-containing protein [Kitasatospora paracochleata]|uniref:DNA-binding response OmpR family regulator n=1 Tax=Kitasatospora paracochleata TaxID=58354 RepID=A0ABT1IV65_9ACTN|nr:winged helix-turn-helix domain-containing protein [Kitasatospora paracochleata]MCP2308486.1 DNA-binding response OmpR family regulator [Kitasatospora paracochleata]
MSSSTATLTVPSATPHLRAVRSVPAERWHQPAPRPAAVPPTVLPVAPAGIAGLPEGATVVAALPQSALPPALLAQLGAHLGETGRQPMVGYLVLVPAAPETAADQPRDDRPEVLAPLRRRPAAPAGHGISVDTDRRTAHVDGHQLDLTYLEFELLAHLTAHPHRVHTRDHLVTAVWGYGHIGDGRTVDVHVARLRRKLGAAHRDTIVTVRRVGYKYAPAA